jgi:hypothetical protein
MKHEEIMSLTDDELWAALCRCNDSEAAMIWDAVFLFWS